MKKIRNLALLLSVVFILTIFTPAKAASFEDVSPTKYNWAINAISSMVEKGIIKGYEDGTFKPENSMTKLEALVLTARVLGFNAPENKSLVNAAIKTYSDKINSYKLNFGQSELAFLIFKNIISLDELPNYVENGAASSGMKRYEIAILLTKALGAEESVKNILVTSLGYSDATKIPAHAKKYVEYVTELDIMNGMGDNTFSPNTDVTRAQAALLFSKILNISNASYKNGLVESFNTNTNLIRITTDSEVLQYNISDTIHLRFEGNKIAFGDILLDWEAVLTYKNGLLYSIDFITPILDFQMNARVVSTSRGNGSFITVYEIPNGEQSISNGEKITFTLGSGCFFVKDNEIIDFEDISPDDYVKLVFKQGKIHSITLLSKNETISGVVSGIKPGSNFSFIVTLSNGIKRECFPDNQTDITKDGLKMNLSDLSDGDMVVVKTDYGKVLKIAIATPVYEKSGIVKEVIISANPRITLEADGILTTYEIADYCIFEINGKGKSTYYDLRVDMPVVISLQSDVVVRINS